MNPIYVEADNSGLEDVMKQIEEKLKELSHLTSFLPYKAMPQLYAVPAPDNDCIRCGGLVVYGVSALDDAEKDALRLFLQALCGE